MDKERREEMFRADQAVLALLAIELSDQRDALLAVARACENAIDRWSIEDFDAILHALEAVKKIPSIKAEIEKK